MNNFVALILSHGRPDRVKTYETLKKQGYTGRVVIVIDNEDITADLYYKKFGDDVVMFDKKEIAKTFDPGDNFSNRKTIIYARNASFEIARKLGYEYFIQLDDDYTSFVYKFNADLVYQERKVKSLDKLFEMLLDYYKSINAITIAIAQNGDFIGGKNSQFAKEIGLKRKCMNTFICSVNRPFKFFGRINEDVNTYTNLGGRGFLMLTIPNVAIIQVQTQKTKGGMTDVYLDGGTYLKSFYTLLYSPSCVKIGEMGDKHKRLHHKVKWNNAVPKILSENLKK